MKALATLLTALLALAATAAGAATLKPQATVDGAMVRLGDLFAGAPDALASRAIAPAPRPGRTTVFEAATLTAIARDAGLAWRPISRFDRAVVRRAARTVTAADVAAAVLAALRRQGLGKDMKVELANRRLALNAATGDGPAFTLGGVRYDRHAGTVSATLRLAAGDGGTERVTVHGAVYQVLRAPVLTRNMRHGQVVEKADIDYVAMRADAIDASTIVDPGSVIGKTPRSAVRAGVALRRSDFVAPVVVARGALVMMTLKTPNLALTAKGRAVENGADGQTIKVQNTRSHVTVEGVVAGPGRVVVNLPSLALR